MGGYNIGDLFGALKLDNTEFLAAMEAAQADVNIFKVQVASMGGTLEAFTTQLTRAGIGLQGLSSFLNSCYAQGMNGAQGLQAACDAVGALQKRISDLHLAELDFGRKGSKFLGPTAGENWSEILKLQGLPPNLFRESNSANDELTEWRSKQEAIRIYTAQVEEARRVRQDYANLTNQLRTQELAGIREQTIATQVGLQQEALYTTAAAAEKAASETEYTGLVNRLRKEEAAATAKLQAQIVADNLARQEEIQAQMVGDAAAQIRIEKEKTAAILAEQRKRTAAAVAANREQDTALQLGAYELGGYRAGRGAQLLTRGVSPGIIGAAAGIGTAALLAHFTVQAAEAARATQNLSIETGLTWQQMRVLEEEAKISGTTLGSLQQAAWRLSEAVEGTGQGGQRAAAALKAMGVEGDSAGQLLTNFLTKLSEIQSDTDRFAKAHDVMGRASYTIQPIVTNMTELRRVISGLGPMLDKELVDRLVNTSQKVSELGIAWDRFKQDLAVTFAPGLTVAMRTVEQNLAIARAFMGIWGMFLTGGMNKVMFGGGYVPTVPTGKIDVNRDRVAAQNWRTGHEQTREELQSLLSDARAQERDSAKALGRTVTPLTPEQRKVEQGLYDQAVKDVKTYTDQIAEIEGKSGDKRTQLEKIRLDAAKAHALAVEDIKYTSVGRIDTFTNQQVRAEELRQQTHNEKMRDIQIKYLNAELAGIEGSRAPQEVARIQAEIQAVKDRAVQQGVEVTNWAAGEQKRIATEDANARMQILARDMWAGQRVANDKNKQVEELRQEGRKDELGAQEESIKGEKSRADKSIALRRQAAKDQEDLGNISSARRLAIERDLDQRQYDLDKQAISQEIAALNASDAHDAQYLTKHQRLVDQSKALDDQLADSRQRHNQEEAKGLDDITRAIEKQIETRKKLELQGNVSEQTMRLATERITTNATRIANEGFGGVGATAMDATINGLSQIDRVLIDATMNGQKFTETLVNGLKKIPETILGEVLGSFEKLAASEIFIALTKKDSSKRNQDLVDQAIHLPMTGKDIISRIYGLDKLGKGGSGGPVDAAQSQATTANTTADQANTLATNANTAALHEATVALMALVTQMRLQAAQQMAQKIAGALGQAGHGGISSFLGYAATAIPFLSSGGEILRSGLAAVHKGEVVLNQGHQAALLSTVVSGMSGRSGSMFDFRGAHFNGTTESDVNRFMTKAIRKTRDSGWRG